MDRLAVPDAAASDAGASRAGRRGRDWRQYWLVHPLEGAAAALVLALLRPLPIAWASWLGGVLGRAVGDRQPQANRRILANLEQLRPEAPPAEREAIRRAAWEHLGRVVAEYAHLDRLWPAGRIEMVGLENLERARGIGRPILVFSGHVGNWELSPVCAAALGVAVPIIYQVPRNRFLDRMLRRRRGACGVPQFPKRRGGAKQAIARLRDGGRLGFLVDERTKDGVLVPAFGREVERSTALTSLARLALQFDCVVLPVRVERAAGARFRTVVHPHLEPARTGPPDAALRDLAARVDAMVEGWVRERPAEWLWLHRLELPRAGERAGPGPGHLGPG